jgi:Domain of unknown function (DUF4440)
MNVLELFRRQRASCYMVGKRFATLAIFAMILSCTTASTAQKTADDRSETARVMALEALWNQAEVDKDLRALDQIIPDTFTYVDIDGSLRNKAEFLENIKNGSEKPSEIRNESAVTHAYAATIVVTGVYREKGTDGAKHYSRRGRYTDTWVNQNGAWHCVASQSTLIEK